MSLVSRNDGDSDIRRIMLRMTCYMTLPFNHTSDAVSVDVVTSDTGSIKKWRNTDTKSSCISYLNIYRAKPYFNRIFLIKERGTYLRCFERSMSSSSAYFWVWRTWSGLQSHFYVSVSVRTMTHIVILTHPNQRSVSNTYQTHDSQFWNYVICLHRVDLHHHEAQFAEDSDQSDPFFKRDALTRKRLHIEIWDSYKHSDDKLWRSSRFTLFTK